MTLTLRGYYSSDQDLPEIGCGLLAYHMGCLGVKARNTQGNNTTCSLIHALTF